MNIEEFATEIIEGGGGMNRCVHSSGAIFHLPERVEVAIWTIKCLANPHCAGSDVALRAILAKRKGAQRKEWPV